MAEEEREGGPGVGRSRWSDPRIVAAIIGAVAVIVAAVLANWPGPAPERPPEGKILEPPVGAQLNPSFTAKGTLASIPGDGHVWLAVQRGNELFPKEPEIPSEDSAWVQELVEGGDTAGQFSLVLLLVDASGQDVIEIWLEQGHGDGFAGFSSSDIPGARRLDVVTGLTVTSTTTSASSFPLEMEAASGDGELENRSNASGGATLLLHDGDSATVPFTVPSPGSYALVVRYSNDNTGPSENVNASVDGQTLAEFPAEDTGDNGFGWNVFVNSPELGPRFLGAGNHELTVSVSGGDGHGVEFDLVSRV